MRKADTGIYLGCRVSAFAMSSLLVAEIFWNDELWCNGCAMVPLKKISRCRSGVLVCFCSFPYPTRFFAKKGYSIDLPLLDREISLSNVAWIR